MKTLFLVCIIIYGLVGFPLGFLLALKYDTDWGIIAWVIFAICCLVYEWFEFLYQMDRKQSGG